MEINWILKESSVAGQQRPMLSINAIYVWVQAMLSPILALYQKQSDKSNGCHHVMKRTVIGHITK